MIKVINDVLNLLDSFSLYEGLIDSDMWHLTRKSSKDIGGCFPGVQFIEDYKIVYNNQYWIGYFNCLFDIINQKLKEQHNFSLERAINRISLNAQNDNHYTTFHTDNDKSYSIIGFLTPQWAEDWGGELNVEGEMIKYKPGDFVLFNSNQLHKSQELNKKLPYWRVTINYVIDKSKA